jgi:hypothetical protein
MARSSPEAVSVRAPRRLLLGSSLLALAGCGSRGGALPTLVATVQFAYHAPTTVDPDHFVLTFTVAADGTVTP